MSTILRVSTLVTTLALLAAACGGAPPTRLETGAPIASSSAAASSRPSTVAVVSPSPEPTAATVRPGYILLEHFGNAADGTKVADPTVDTCG